MARSPTCASTMCSNAASLVRTACTAAALAPAPDMAPSRISMPSLPGISGTASRASLVWRTLAIFQVRFLLSLNWRDTSWGLEMSAPIPS